MLGVGVYAMVFVVRLATGRVREVAAVDAAVVVAAVVEAVFQTRRQRRAETSED